MYPNKIEVCPILDTGIEIRFESNLYKSAVFGVLFNKLKEQFPIPEKLPILQLPEQLRDSDPNFKFKPHYKLKNEKIIIQIGPDVITISSPIPYVGWQDYSKNIFEVLELVFSLNIITKVNRLGVRYINFFETNIFDKLDVTIDIKNLKLPRESTIFRTEILSEGFINVIHIANKITQLKNKVPTVGSIIDIDTIRNYSENKFLSDYKTELKLAHDVEKGIFFDLLKPDFLQSLNPIYD
jgi:uncharacterized protein (TIGR04255 family)